LSATRRRDPDALGDALDPRPGSALTRSATCGYFHEDAKAQGEGGVIPILVQPQPDLRSVHWELDVRWLGARGVEVAGVI